MRGLKFDSSELQVFSFLGFFANINRGGHFKVQTLMLTHSLMPKERGALAGLGQKERQEGWEDGPGSPKGEREREEIPFFFKPIFKAFPIWISNQISFAKIHTSQK